MVWFLILLKSWAKKCSRNKKLYFFSCKKFVRSVIFFSLSRSWLIDSSYSCVWFDWKYEFQRHSNEEPDFKLQMGLRRKWKSRLQVVGVEQLVALSWLSRSHYELSSNFGNCHFSFSLPLQFQLFFSHLLLSFFHS